MDYNRVVVKIRRQFGLVCDDNEFCATRLHFLGSGSHMMGMLVIQNNHNDWCCTEFPFRVLNQRKWAMLECTPTVSLRMQITHFLDLQRPLVSNRLGISFAQDETVLLVLQSLGNFLTLLMRAQSHPKGDGQSHQALLELSRFLTRIGTRKSVTQFTEPKSYQRQHSYLRGKRLGTRHSIFPSSITVDSEFGRASNQATDCIHNTHDGHPLVHRSRYNANDIFGLSRLGYYDHAGTLHIISAGDVLDFGFGRVERCNAIKGA
mmetsp:Transcript_34045/g.53155  ORF Transcript_34045/g.53155 Transcript_34045/m.53155 type:complete len:262 (+) Transcript_34045:243-1028(+)